MKYKKILNQFGLFLILYIGNTLIASAQQKDSIKYSVNESKALIDAYLNYEPALNALDSCEVKSLILTNDLKASIDLCKSYKEKAADERKYRELADKTINELNEDNLKANKWRYRWRSITGFFAATTLTLIGYELVK